MVGYNNIKLDIGISVFINKLIKGSFIQKGLTPSNIIILPTTNNLIIYTTLTPVKPFISKLYYIKHHHSKLLIKHKYNHNIIYRNNHTKSYNKFNIYNNNNYNKRKNIYISSIDFKKRKSNYINQSRSSKGGSLSSVSHIK